MTSLKSKLTNIPKRGQALLLIAREEKTTSYRDDSIAHNTL
jgi:hypothetical protein